MLQRPSLAEQSTPRNPLCDVITGDHWKVISAAAVNGNAVFITVRKLKSQPASVGVAVEGGPVGRRDVLVA